VGTRTPNQLIKSQLLYQLSYRGNILYSNALQKSHSALYFDFVHCTCVMMKTRTPDTKADAKSSKDIRDPNLSKVGKRRSFPKVPHMLLYVSTGTFYGRVTVDGKIYRESLETTVYSDARQTLPDSN
jgi:hypothetical protein